VHHERSSCSSSSTPASAHPRSSAAWLARHEPLTSSLHQRLHSRNCAVALRLTADEARTPSSIGTGAAQQLRNRCAPGSPSTSTHGLPLRQHRAQALDGADLVIMTLLPFGAEAIDILERLELDPQL
jgi:hypothetical protein